MWLARTLSSFGSSYSRSIFKCLVIQIALLMASGCITAEGILEWPDFGQITENTTTTPQWIPIQIITSPAGYSPYSFAGSVDIYEDKIAVGTQLCTGLVCGVHIYRWEVSEYVHHQTIDDPTDSTLYEFGKSVAMSKDYLIVGAQGERYNDSSTGYVEFKNVGKAYLYKKNSTDHYNLLRTLEPTIPQEKLYFGRFVEILTEPVLEVLVGAGGEKYPYNSTLECNNGNGVVYSFFLDSSGEVSQTSKIHAADSCYDIGYRIPFMTITVQNGGEFLVIGHPYALESQGIANIYKRGAGNSWEFLQEVQPNYKYKQTGIFGAAAVIIDDLIVISAPQSKCLDNTTEYGSVESFQYSSESEKFVFVQAVCASDILGVSESAFGYPAALISGKRTFVAATTSWENEDSMKTGNIVILSSYSGGSFTIDSRWTNYTMFPDSYLQNGTDKYLGRSLSADDNVIAAAYFHKNSDFEIVIYHEKCPPGGWRASSESCSFCEPGLMSVGSESPPFWEFCDACKTGSFSFEYGSSNCQKCPSGSWTSSDKSTRCSDCFLGEWAPSEDNEGNCLNCVLGDKKEDSFSSIDYSPKCGVMMLAKYSGEELHGEMEIATTYSVESLILNFHSNGSINWLKFMGMFAGTQTRMKILDDNCRIMYIFNFFDYIAFIKIMDSKGNLDYLTYIGVSSKEFVEITAVETFQDGNETYLYIAGNTDAASFYDVPSKGLQDVFLYVLNVDTKEWTVRCIYGSSDDDFVFGAAVDEEGSAYLTGNTNGLFEPAYSISNLNGDDVFVAKIEKTGNVSWSMQFGNVGLDEGIDIFFVDNTLWVFGNAQGQWWDGSVVENIEESTGFDGSGIVPFRHFGFVSRFSAENGTEIRSSSHLSAFSDPYVDEKISAIAYDSYNQLFFVTGVANSSIGREQTSQHYQSFLLSIGLDGELFHKFERSFSETGVENPPTGVVLVDGLPWIVGQFSEDFPFSPYFPYGGGQSDAYIYRVQCPPNTVLRNHNCISVVTGEKIIPHIEKEPLSLLDIILIAGGGGSFFAVVAFFAFFRRRKKRHRSEKEVELHDIKQGFARQSTEETETDSVANINSIMGDIGGSISTIGEFPERPKSMNPASNRITMQISRDSGTGHSVILPPADQHKNAIAVFDFKGVDYVELTFKRNEMIDVTQESNDEWWLGTNISTGKSGYFPKTYVKYVQSL